MFPSTASVALLQIIRRVRGLATAVAYAATITPKPNQYDILNVGTLTGNVTVANPTGVVTDGQRITLRITQDATGGRTVTWGNAYVFSTQAPANGVLTTANAKSEITFRYHKDTAKWRAIEVASGF